MFVILFFRLVARLGSNQSKAIILRNRPAPWFVF